MHYQAGWINVINHGIFEVAIQEKKLNNDVNAVKNLF